MCVCRSHGYTGIIKECVKLFVLQVLILFMWVVYPTLAAMAKKYRDSLGRSPGVGPPTAMESSPRRCLPCAAAAPEDPPCAGALDAAIS